MLTLVLIRPGATDYDGQGRIQGVLDIPLNAEGQAEAAKTADALRSLNLKVLYGSPCLSASETARVIGRALDVKVKSLETMRNLNHGLWQGQSIEEIRRTQPTLYRQWQEHPESICPPGGETLSDAMSRVQAAMAKLAKKHKDGVVGLVVPEPLASMVRVAVRGGELGDLWRAPAAHGQWEALELNRAPVTAAGPTATQPVDL